MLNGSLVVALDNKAGNASYDLSLPSACGSTSCRSKGATDRRAPPGERDGSDGQRQEGGALGEGGWACFRGSWPLDHDLQTSASTFKLVQLLLATDPHFRRRPSYHTLRSGGPEQGAIPRFMPSPDASTRSSIRSRCHAGGFGGSGRQHFKTRIFSLGKALERIRQADSNLVNHRKFQALQQLT